MTSRKESFDQLQIASSCKADWQTMSGGDQKRYCAECNKFVYDFSRLTPGQIEALVAGSRRGLCARLTRDEYGALITLEPTPAASSSSRRISTAASAVISVLVSLSSTGLALPPIHLNGPAAVQTHQDDSQTKAETGNATATLTVTVTDPAGAMIPNASAILINRETGESNTKASDENGQIRFTQLSAGIYLIRIEASGFVIGIVGDITITAGQQAETSISLQTREETVTVGSVGPAPQPLRQLFSQSDLIAVVTVGDSVNVESENADKEDSERRTLRTSLSVSSAIRNEGSESVVYLYRQLYGEEPDEFKPGEQLLVFLDRRNVGNGYEARQNWYAIKRLKSEELSVYLERMRELEELLQKEKPATSEILEWLVKCVEHPATRWEGAYELNLDIESFRHLTLKDNEAEEESAASTVAQPEAEDPDDEADDEEEEQDKKVYSLLSDSQKERVTKAFFNSDGTEQGNGELINLFLDQKDARLIPWILRQLRSMDAAPGFEAGYLLHVLSEAKDDPAIHELANSWNDQAEFDESDIEAAGKAGSAKEKPVMTEAAKSRSRLLRNILSQIEARLSRKM
jgi:hypothetical protein